MLTGSLEKTTGGFFQAIKQLSCRLGQDGVDVTVVGLSNEAERAAAEWAPVQIKACPTIGPTNFGFSWDLRSTLETTPADILHVHGLWMYQTFVSIGYVNRHKVPLVISPHGMLDTHAIGTGRLRKHLALLTYERRHFRLCKVVHALNDAEVGHIRARGIQNDIEIVSNGVEIRDQDDPIRRAKTFLYLGRLHEKKNVVKLIEGWSKFLEFHEAVGWNLVIAGFGEDRYAQKLKHLVNTPDMERTVSFVGPQFGRTKQALLNSASALIMPSLSEGMPMTILEAWASGLPVLMSEQCNLPIGFEAGAAWRIQTTSEAICTALFEWSTTTPAYRATIGGRGRELAVAYFDWAIIGSRMKALYSHVIRDTSNANRSRRGNTLFDPA